tara:strand:+ start:47 stop:1123 length:1077 start_codon:yes stop_codon:yes gene_type:complete
MADNKKPKVKQSSVFPGASLWSILTSGVGKVYEAGKEYVEEKEEDFKERVMFASGGYDYDFDKWDAALRFMKGGGLTDEWIIEQQERIYPTALENKTQRKWKKGDLEKDKIPPIRIRERIDQMLFSSGKPQKYGEIIESDFKPAVGAEEGEKFYTFKDPEQMSTIYKGRRYKDEKRSEKAGEARYSYAGGLMEKTDYMEKETARRKEENKIIEQKNIKRGARGETPLPLNRLMFNVGYQSDVDKGESEFVNPGVIGMARYQVGVGEDPVGKYMSIYDKWDLDPPGKVADKIGDWAMPGFEMYDRIYYGTSNLGREPEFRRGPPSEPYAPQKVPVQQMPTGTSKLSIEDKIMNFLHKMI